MSKRCYEVNGILRGEIVRALRHLDHGVASVEPGTLGVLFEYSNAYGDGCGPMVRWFTGTACNVYDGDVELYQLNPFAHDCTKAKP